MHAVHRYGLLLQLLHVDIARCVCVSDCVDHTSSLLIQDHTSALCKNGQNDQDGVWGGGADSCLSKERCTRLGSRSDEYIYSHEEKQHGDAAFCQITLNTYSLL